jgi:2'-5' RNA ligase
MGFPHDTFVVADVAPAVEDHVRAIRRRYGSARQYLPVEVTLTGSSGVGVFAPEQDPEAALRAVQAIAESTAPFPMAFTAVERFPASDVFYYAIQDAAPLFGLHERLRASGLHFKESPFPFSPHLTVDVFEEADERLARELFALPLPPSPITIETLSVYSLEGWICRRVGRYALGPTR